MQFLYFFQFSTINQNGAILSHENADRIHHILFSGTPDNGSSVRTEMEETGMRSTRFAE